MKEKKLAFPYTIMKKMFNMKIGLISDTHDNIQIIQNAISLFNDKHVSFVIHAGDSKS